MSYTFDKTLNTTFDHAILKVTEALKARGFGVLTTIDVQKALKERIGKDIHPYTILGACSPQHAFQALSLEDKIGSMMPCNVVVQEKVLGSVDISAVDPIASMSAIHNPQLRGIAVEVQGLLREVMNGL
ncbi:hypothetical protein RIEGSTA812A_PEG_671 [invertebrate metagenome]|uniref:DUF302 domain-containing protein n=1 Tax=invertebrate metagenome TaxID=1711999 RepID=A0A484HAP4_9ZZZZ